MFPNGVTRAVDGAIYGTTPMRGAADCGTLFKWIANGPLQTLHAFDCGLDGGEPAAPPIQSSDGALYGTTVSGGAHGLGTIYRWNGTALTTLHSFDGATGMHPYAGLIHGMDGALYGVASSGGGHGGGTVFKWFQGTITVLHSFDHSYAEGRNPRGALVQRADGSLVGTTRNGGPYGFGAFEDGYGTVFTLSDSTYTVAHNFSGNDGQHPEGNLTLLPDGTIVGTTSNGSPTRGSIFRFDGSVVTTLRSFNDHLITGEPPSGLILGSDENLIGSTMNAGVGGAGTLFRLLLNAAPILDSVTASASPIAVDSAVTIRATFTDAPSFRHTCTFAWNDGTPDTVAAASSGTCSASHAFDDAGVYTVSVSVTDGGGLSDTKASPFIVVYDPSAGFVTGDGWIQSPAGAYAALPGLEGRADFAFVSRYKKGASAPTGQTQFQFQIGSFNFASATYEWLVVAGGRAQFKGRGTVNGEGDYGFLLTATDGDANGGRGTDRFRIKIWDRVSAAIVYDNVAGAVDGFDSAVTQAIGGGSIVIHAK